tara:strand:+ start:6926 stop:9070 length:2145 start_codon:yes stop_codon:yes gene_type:complete
MLGRKYAKAKKTLKSIAKYIAIICVLSVIIWYSIEPIIKGFTKYYIDFFGGLLDRFDNDILQVKRDKNGVIISADLKRRSYVYSITYAFIVVVTIGVLRYLNKDNDDNDNDTGLTPMRFITICLVLFLLSLLVLIEKYINIPIFTIIFFIILGRIIIKKLISSIKNTKKEDRNDTVFIITNSILFYFIIVFIIHILWIVIVYTAPDMSNNINLGKDKGCSLPWLYYGTPTPEDDKILDRINRYMFDITYWFSVKDDIPKIPGVPDALSLQSSFKCQPCPLNKTPRETEDSNSIKTGCRPCRTGEEWVSVKTLAERFNKGLLSKKDIDKFKSGFKEDGTLNEEDNSIKQVLHDYDTIDLDNPLYINRGMCLKNNADDWEEILDGDCDSYSDCMDNNYKGKFIELSWSKNINDPVNLFPEQRIDILNLNKPIGFYLPSDIMKAPCSPPPVDRDKYNNPICNKKHDGKGEKNKCYLLLPVGEHIDKISEPNNAHPIIRRSGDVSCDDPNIIAQEYETENALKPDKKSINDTTNKSVNEGDNDWRNIYQQVQDNCYSSSKGNCYINNSICHTKINTPLPLVDYNNTGKGILTIPTASNIGCRNIAKSCSINNDECVSIDVDEDGNVVDGKGNCKYSKWNETDNKWDLKDDEDEDYELRCMNNNTANNTNLKYPDNVNYDDSIFDTRKGLANFQDMCRSIHRFEDFKLELIDNTNNPCR